MKVYIIFHPKKKYFYGAKHKKTAIEFATDVRNETWAEMLYDGWDLKEIEYVE